MFIMLYAFFDESGIHKGAKVLGVGGWIATEDEFSTLVSHWSTVLRRARVKVFHFVDFNHSIKEFAGWTPRLKGEFLKDLFDVLDRRDVMGVTGAILMDDFKETIKGSAGTVLHETYGPYWVCLQYCIEVISKRVTEEVVYVIDRQQEFDSPLASSFYTLKKERSDFSPKMMGITFRPKTEFLALQAADLLVGETVKSTHNRFYEPARPIRKSFLALLEMRKKLIGGYFDKSALANVLRAAMTPADPGRQFLGVIPK